MDPDVLAAWLPTVAAPSAFTASHDVQTAQSNLPLFSAPTNRRNTVQANLGKNLCGANQGGYHHPDDDGTLPSGARYEGMYSARALAYISSVANASLICGGVPPVEVQTGHAFNDRGDYTMAISTNNTATQAMLVELLMDPVTMCKAMAALTPTAPSDSAGPTLEESAIPVVNQHATKLLLWDQVDKRRREAIVKDLAEERINEDQAQQRLADLALATRAVRAFFEREVGVVLTDHRKGPHKDQELREYGMERADAYRSKTDELSKKYDGDMAAFEAARKLGKDASRPKKPSNTTTLGDGRHAEQNVADEFYRQSDERVAMGEDPYTHGEIQGTMIRCLACTHQLGQNVTLDDPGHTPSAGEEQRRIAVAGRGFFSQAPTELFDEGFSARDGDVRTETGPPGRDTVSAPWSPGSPPPSPPGDF